MPIAKITGQGLFAIACSVALLWTCLFAERVIVHRAAGERRQLLQEMKPIRRIPTPLPGVAPGIPRRLPSPAVC